MRHSLVIQDPTSPATIYHFETLVEAAGKGVEWRGLFAFATRDGIDKLLNDDAFVEFFERGGVASLTVGIDAVTNRAALERLLEFGQRYAGLRATVFWTPISSLFHPKLSHFRLQDGSERLIVGSGNLTPGGLQGNFEAYSIIASEAGEHLDVAELDGFLLRHGDLIRPIDDAALDRAAQNIIQRVKGRVKIVPPVGPDDVAPAPPPVEPPAPLQLQRRVLIAQVPLAGGRWEQAHFNAAVVAEFFRVTDLNAQRVFTTYVLPNGARSDEHPRRVIYSTSNKNYKVEVENPGGRAYPADGRPVLVMLETGVRSFEYCLLMPGEWGHAQMFALTTSLPSLGRGLPRVVSDLAHVRSAWPDVPFLMPPI